MCRNKNWWAGKGFPGFDDLESQNMDSLGRSQSHEDALHPARSTATPALRRGSFRVETATAREKVLGARGVLVMRAIALVHVMFSLAQKPFGSQESHWKGFRIPHNIRMERIWRRSASLFRMAMSAQAMCEWELRSAQDD